MSILPVFAISLAPSAIPKIDHRCVPAPSENFPDRALFHPQEFPVSFYRL